MEDLHTVLRIASFASENRRTGKVVEVALWDEDIIPGEPAVTIATDEGVQTLSLGDMPGIVDSIQALLNFTKN